MQMIKRMGLFLLLVIWLTACGKSIKAQVQEQLDLGNQYLEELDYENAVVAFNKAIELEPKTVDAYKGLADVQIALGELEIAVEYLTQGADVYFSISETEQTAENKAAYEKIIQCAVKILTDMAVNAEDDENAIKYYERALEWDEKNVSLYLSLAGIYTGYERWDEAIEILRLGYERTQDEDIQEKLSEIEVPYGDDEVVWSDTALEKLVRNAVGIPSGTVYVRDLDDIHGLTICGDTNIDINGGKFSFRWTARDGDREILEAYYGDENEDAVMERGQISDIASLRYFRNIKSVDIIANHISDVSVLEQINLEYANFWANDIADTSILHVIMEGKDERVDKYNDEQFVEIGDALPAIP